MASGVSSSQEGVDYRVRKKFCHMHAKLAYALRLSSGQRVAVGVTFGDLATWQEIRS